MYEYVIYILLAIILIILGHLLYKKLTTLSDATTSIFSSANVMSVIPSFGSASGAGGAATSSDSDNIGGSA